MSESTPEPTPESPAEPNPESNLKPSEVLPSPLNSLTGALIAGTFAIALYKLTQTIAINFATNPIASKNPLALNISAAVRTLVVGASTLATGIFTIAAFSLVLLAIQVAFQAQKNKSVS